MKVIKDLKTYLPFAANSFQRMISYKANMLMFMFGDFLMLAVTFCLWTAVYDSSSSEIINGFTFKEMIIYVFISFITSILTSVDVAGSISNEVREGSIAINLIRPIQYEKRMLFEGLGSIFYSFVVIAIVALTATSALFYHYFGYLHLSNYIFYFISIILGIGVNFYLNYSFGLLSFKIVNMWGMSQIMQAITNLFSGALIPMVFFPIWAQKVFNFFPFSSMIYTPSMIFLGKISGAVMVKALLLQCLWIVILMVISKLIWRLLIKNLTVVGG